MAKRVSAEEKPFNPVADHLSRSVLQPQYEHTSLESAPPQQANLLASEGSNSNPSQEQQKHEAKPEEESSKHKKLGTVRRFLLTDEENFTLEKLAMDVGRRLGTTIDVSHLLRAVTTILLNSSEELLKQGVKMKGLKRPSNKDSVGLVAFEHNLTRLVDRAIRNSKIPE